MLPDLTTLLRAMPLAPRVKHWSLSPAEFVRQNGQVPADYLPAFARYHGGAGQVGAAYLELWEPEELAEANLAYQVAEYAPGFTIFGSDGGGTAYAFARQSGFIYAFPLIGMTLDEPATLLSQSFEGFLQGLYTQSDE